MKTKKPSSIHPWRTYGDAGKLKAARIIAAKRRQKQYYLDNQEVVKRQCRDRYRTSAGIPLEIPPMKPGQRFNKPA